MKNILKLSRCGFLVAALTGLFVLAGTGQVKAYGYHHGYYHHHYASYHHHGYWRERNGVRVFIGL